MKLALLSDIHANRQALDACLAHAEAAGAKTLPRPVAAGMTLASKLMKAVAYRV